MDIPIRLYIFVIFFLLDCASSLFHTCPDNTICHIIIICASPWAKSLVHSWYTQTYVFHVLTHWGRVTHICVDNLTNIGPDNGLSPGRRQAIIWTNAGILLIGPWETKFIEILIGIQAFSFTKMHLKMSSAKWRPFCLGLNVFSGDVNQSYIYDMDK